MSTAKGQKTAGLNEDNTGAQNFDDYDDGANQYAGMGDTGTQGLQHQIQEINELDAKHDYYADELEKIKAMLN